MEHERDTLPGAQTRAGARRDTDQILMELFGYFHGQIEELRAADVLT